MREIHFIICTGNKGVSVDLQVNEDEIRLLEVLGHEIETTSDYDFIVEIEGSENEND